MTRNRAGLVLVLVLASLGAGMSWYLSTLTAISQPPAPGSDPARWWDCTRAATASDSPPACLGGE